MIEVQFATGSNISGGVCMYTFDPVWMRENPKDPKTCFLKSLKMDAVPSFQPGKRTVERNQ